MTVISIPSRTGLNVSCEFHEAPDAKRNSMTVLKHGLCHSRAMFEPLIGKLLDRGIHVATVDGQTTNNWKGLSSYREGLAEGIQALQQHTQRAVGSICGHSMGGLIVQEAQEKYQALQMPTVLMAPIPLGGAMPATMRALIRHPREYMRLFKRLKVLDVFDENVVRSLFFNKGTPYPVVKQTTEQLTDTPFSAYLELCLRPVVRPRIHNNGQPVLLLRSETDFLFRDEDYDSTRRLYEDDLEEDVIAGGHDFFIKNAGKAADKIATFHYTHAI